MKINGYSFMLIFIFHGMVVSGFFIQHSSLIARSKNSRFKVRFSSDGNSNDIVSDSSPSDEPSNKIIRPLAGGPSLIFAMAQRLNLWEDMVNDSSNCTNMASTYTASTLPRYRKSSQGISNINPNFRTSPPIMNKKGYASSIIRNARKKNKPGLWRYSFRTYQKLKSIELLSSTSTGTAASSSSPKNEMNDLFPLSTPSTNGLSDVSSKGITNTKSSTTTSSSGTNLNIYRETVHFQGVMVAVAKLGLWQEAINMYQELQDLIDSENLGDSNSGALAATVLKRKKSLKVSNSILVSLVDACVRGMKLSNSREPLDQALKIILSMKERHNLTPSHIHMNKLASGYQYLGLYEESKDVLSKLLELENDYDGSESTTVDYVNIGGGSGGSKKASNSMQIDRMTLPSTNAPFLNEASYKILVQNAIRDGDWAQSIQNLRRMTEEGIFPKSKTLNAWSEAASKRERRPKKNKWVKKRERLLVKGLELDRTNGEELQ